MRILLTPLGLACFALSAALTTSTADNQGPLVQPPLSTEGDADAAIPSETVPETKPADQAPLVQPAPASTQAAKPDADAASGIRSKTDPGAKVNLKPGPNVKVPFRKTGDQNKTYIWMGVVGAIGVVAAGVCRFVIDRRQKQNVTPRRSMSF